MLDLGQWWRDIPLVTRTMFGLSLGITGATKRARCERGAHTQTIVVTGTWLTSNAAVGARFGFVDGFQMVLSWCAAAAHAQRLGIALLLLTVQSAFSVLCVLRHRPLVFNNFHVRARR